MTVPQAAVELAKRFEGFERKVRRGVEIPAVPYICPAGFWHGCPEHATWPKQNAEFWRQKIEANRTRDTETNERLRSIGWTVLRFWEHEPPTEAAEIVVQAVAMGKSKRCASSASSHKKN